ncbi:MAG: phosphoribosylformylglycinamidine synthase subunit PurQ [candidate division NC10 bacterium]|nr:phosphoribosylformylglycinamidine synthase subunit PurQ [candidate division NC10 bacterium]MBI3002756.1 phosphoribosylformylglycinamidine synthase subunit PurQ [candidate division NC10 bacterium]
MRFGILVFPGSWSHQDFQYMLGDVMGFEAQVVWHKATGVEGFDCLILPGGFAHGDYLRAGAIARFSPVMPAVIRFAERGGLVLGSCNGFQILCEAGLLPGALLRNASLQYRCQWVHLRVESTATPFTAALAPGRILRMPISHGEGRYHADAETLRRLGGEGRVIFRYCAPDGTQAPEANPNGSAEHIAGICNAQGNVLGLMPHPERAAEGLLGSEDGRLLFDALLARVPG